MRRALLGNKNQIRTIFSWLESPQAPFRLPQRRNSNVARHFPCIVHKTPSLSILETIGMPRHLIQSILALLRCSMARKLRSSISGTTRVTSNFGSSDLPRAFQTTENHCASVNFPLVSPRAERMAARLLEYGAPRIRKRIQKRKSERWRDPGELEGQRKEERKRNAQPHVCAHTRTACVRVPRKFERSICMLVFSRIFPPCRDAVVQ